jgi:hypothetical protein
MWIVIFWVSSELVGCRSSCWDLLCWDLKILYSTYYHPKKTLNVWNSRSIFIFRCDFSENQRCRVCSTVSIAALTFIVGFKCMNPGKSAGMKFSGNMHFYVQNESAVRFSMNNSSSLWKIIKTSKFKQLLKKPFSKKSKILSKPNSMTCLVFYLPHMEYEGSIGLVTRKMKNFYCRFSRFRTFYDFMMKTWFER